MAPDKIQVAGRALVLLAAAGCARSQDIPSMGPLEGIYPVSNAQLGLRHCNYHCSATPVEAGVDDFRFTLVPALNGFPLPAGSFQSKNYPTYYLSLINGSVLVGIVETPEVNDASWTFAAGLSPPPANVSNSFSLKSLSIGPLASLYLTLNTSNNNPCAYTAPSGDVIVAAASTSPQAATWLFGAPPPLSPALVTVDGRKVVNPAVNKRWMGCHSDYGYAQAPRGFTANLMYGSSFETGTMSVPSWRPFTSDGANAAIGLSTSITFSSKASMGISLPGDAPSGAYAGVANRGIGSSGLFLQAGKEYLFEAFMWAGQGDTAFVELHDFTSNTVLASQTFQVVSTGPAWGSTWIHYNFSLTPSQNTSCESIPFGSDPTIDCGNDAGDAYICMRCGGELVVGINGAGASVNIGFVSLTPGAWGLVHNAAGSPLPVLKSAGDVLQAMGTTVIRSGGTVSQSMRWKDWRGPVWNRPSQQQVWGDSLLSGWGPFEVIDMCNALDIQPILTFAYDLNDVTDWGDLVEYCWGDAEATTWGRRRAADGHPSVFNITVFELGNEQYNPYWIDQVVEMEARSKAVGSPPLHYMFPDNGGLNAADAARAVSLGIPIERLMPDLHVGAGGAVGVAATLFANPPVPGFNQSAINCETNANAHDLNRALAEAADLIDFFTADTTVTDRIYARTASFCTGTASQFDSWDQGISFFLPSGYMSWLQPPGHVHAMIAQTWADTTVQATFNSSQSFPFSAHITTNGSQVVLRAVNTAAADQPVTIGFSNLVLSGSNATVWTLTGASSSDDNTLSFPNKVTPVQSIIGITSTTSLSLILPAISFVVVVATL